MQKIGAIKECIDHCQNEVNVSAGERKQHIFETTYITTVGQMLLKLEKKIKQDVPVCRRLGALLIVQRKVVASYDIFRHR